MATHEERQAMARIRAAKIVRPKKTERTPIDNQVAYELLGEIRRRGTEIVNAIDSYRTECNDVQRVLDSDDAVRATFITHTASPSQMLSDLRGLCELARKLGIPDAAIVASRRGEFVSIHDFRRA